MEAPRGRDGVAARAGGGHATEDDRKNDDDSDLLPSLIRVLLPHFLDRSLARPRPIAVVAELLSWTCKTKEEILAMPPHCSGVTWIVYGVPRWDSIQK